MVSDSKRVAWFVEVAEAMELQPRVLDDRGGLVSITVNGRERIFSCWYANPNSSVASRLASDKHYARIIFEDAGLPNIPFCLPQDMALAKRFLAEHGRIIVKPRRGRKSRGISLVSSEAELEKLTVSGHIAEKFVKGQEVRVLVVEDQVKAVHYKMYEGEINDPETVRRVSLPESDWDIQLNKMAVRCAQVIGLRFSVVDFLVTDSGEAFILEINAGPGLDRFQYPAEGPSVDIMRLFLEQLVKTC